MRRVVLGALLVLALGGPSSADPFDDFFDYEKPRIPPTGPCEGAAWYGEFSGNRYDSFLETYRPASARGCFQTEAECRRWQNDAISTLDRGPIYYAICRPLG